MLKINFFHLTFKTIKTKKLKIAATLLFFSLLSSSSIAQNNFNNGNNQYSKIGGIWFLLTQNGNPVFEVEPTVITVKFDNGVSDQQKNNIYSSTNVTVLRTNSLGYIDLEIQNPE